MKGKVATAFPFVLGILAGTMITTLLSSVLLTLESEDSIFASVQGRTGSKVSQDDYEDLKASKIRKVSPTATVSYNVLVSQGELLRRGLAIHKTWSGGEQKFPFKIEGRVWYYVDPIDQKAQYPVQLKKQLKKMTLIDTSTIEKHQDWNPVLKDAVFRVWWDICQHKLERYLWFVIVRDSTYLRKEKLEELLSSLNSSEPIFMGNPVLPEGREREDLGLLEGESYCHKSCYILSWKTLEKVCPEILSCQERPRSTDGDVELARCIKIHAGISCTSASEMKDLFYSAETALEQEDLLSGGHVMLKASTISLSPLTRPDHFYHLHLHYTKTITDSLSKSIADQKAHTLQAEERDSPQEAVMSLSEQSFPRWTKIGIHTPYQPLKPEEDVINFQMLSNSTVYSESLNMPSRSISSLEKAELEQVREAVIAPKNAQATTKLNLTLESVLKRVDLKRGVDYFLQVIEREDGLSRTKFLHGLRGFLPVKVNSLVATDYKHTKVNFVLASQLISRGVQSFMLSFENAFLSRTPPEKVGLLLVVYDDGIIREYERDIPAVSTLLNLYKKKYPKADLRAVFTNANYSRRHMLQTVSKEIQSYELLFLADIHIEFTLQLLQRCRMNAVENKQVYIPTIFSPYSPAEFQQEKILLPYASRFQMKGNRGAWMNKGSHIACLYNHDLARALDNSESENQWNILRMFEEMEGIRVFRAVEPGLIHLWHESCKDIQSNSTNVDMCSTVRSSH